MTTHAHPKERCPTCRGLVGRPNNVIDRDAVIDPPADMVRYLAVWGFLRMVDDLPEMCERVAHIIETEGVTLVGEEIPA